VLLYLTQLADLLSALSVLLLLHQAALVQCSASLLRPAVLHMLLLLLSSLFCLPVLLLPASDPPAPQDQVQAALLLYQALLPYWLPACLACLPLAKLARLPQSGGEKQHSVSLALVTTVSFAVFHLPLASLGLTRSLLSVCGTRISPHALWIFRVLRSLARLISLFQHVFRPLACHVLGGEIGGGREEPGPHHAHLLAL